MNRYKRILAILSAVALTCSVYAAAGEPASAQKPEAVKAADPPTTPAGGTPPGFPVLAVPLAIAIGVGVALSTDDNSATISTTGTSTGTR